MGGFNSGGASGGVALSFLTAAVSGTSESFTRQLRSATAAATAAGCTPSSTAAGGDAYGAAAMQHGTGGGGGMAPGGGAAAAGGGRNSNKGKGMGWLPEFMRRCI
jgi:hypothetical protein